jgi:transcriptional regulator with XRE-family HTH domain
MIRDARHAAGLTQAQAADTAGIPRSTYASVEGRGKGGVTLVTLSRAVVGARAELRAYVSGGSAGERPRDAVHLRHQELVLRVGAGGGWAGVPETAIDRDARTSRSADVVLHRAREWALMEITDWVDDVGATLRDWDRRLAALEAYAIARMPLPEVGGAEAELPIVSGCWVLRATIRNRRLVAEHRHVFRSRFPGSARAWIAALSTGRPMPDAPALLWVRVDGSALFPSRLG